MTVDLRSNIAAESRAKIVYEYLLKFIDHIADLQCVGDLLNAVIADLADVDQTVTTRQDADECTKLCQRNDRSVEGAADGVVVLQLLPGDVYKRQARTGLPRRARRPAES